MNFIFWIGVLGAGGLMGWSISNMGVSGTLINLHGLIIVMGGTLAAIFINCPLRVLWSALSRLVSLFLPDRLPPPEEVINEVARLARVSQTQGGILSLQDQSRDFADGFLHRAVTIAITNGESSEIRRILESEIKQLRINAQEDGNVFRTMGMLSPMFGLLGTLMGMIRVMEAMSEPGKAGPAMALALSSAFMGIGLANMVCVPIAGQIRLVAMRETLVLEMILEGVLDIAAGKAPYLVELHLASYSQQRRQALERGAAPTAEGVPR